MDLILDKTIRYRTYIKEFDIGFVYVQQKENNVLKDDFFTIAGSLYPDGTLRPHSFKLFYSPLEGDEVKKEIGIVKPESFKWFDKLYYIHSTGETKKFG